MALFLAVGAYLAWRDRLERSRRWLTAGTLAFVLPALAIQLGWATAEIGRQPWIVYGVMRTAEATSPVVSGPEIVFSIALFAAIYVVIGALWLYLVARVLREGPVQEFEAPGSALPTPKARPLRPVEAR